MNKFENRVTNTAIVLMLVVVVIAAYCFGAIASSKPAHAEGTTFTNVLRQAGKHGVYITLISSPTGANTTGWVTITDLTDSYVCAKGQKLICVPTDKISSVTIDDVDSLPSGGQ